MASARTFFILAMIMMRFSPSLTLAATDFANCGVSVGCVTSSTLQWRVAFAKSASGNSADFVLEADGIPNPGYAAVGFNSQTQMTGASIVLCVVDGQTVSLSTAYASAQTLPSLSTPASLGLTDAAGSFANGKLTCTFTRNTSITGNQQFADISASKCLLAAYGPYSSGQIQFHAGKDAALGCASNFLATTQFSSTSGGEQEPLDLIDAIHGICMIVAWIVLVSIGMMTARYYKKTFGKDMQICGKDGWFRIHQVVQTLAVLLFIAGFVLILVEEGHFVSTSSTAFPHAVTGTIAVCLGALQPIGAFFRCSPDDSKRGVFNVLHRSFGNIARWSAVTTIFLAMNIDDIAGFLNRSAWIITLVVFIGVEILVCIMQELHMRKFGGRNPEVTNIVGDQNMHIGEGHPPPEHNASAKSRHKVLFVLYVLFVTAIAVALIVLLLM